MNPKIKKSAISAFLFGILSITLVFLLKNVDIAPVGKFGSVVGLSSVNKFFYDLFGFNMFWYKFTGIPGIAVDVLVGALFAFIGLKQWIKRRSLFKVDKSLFILGATYIISLLVYVIFEKFVINYRPTILPDEKILEPSFPSSHTMWVIIVMGAAIIECKRLVKNINFKRAIDIILYSIIFITIIGRMISGAHWFTDILGGIFIGSALLSLYYLAVNVVDRKKKKIFKKYNSPTC